MSVQPAAEAGFTPGTADPTVLEDALARCVDTIESCTVASGGRVGWGTWELDDQGEAVQLSAGRACLYDGNAGIAWALRLLGRGVPGAAEPADGPGLLAGAAGEALASGEEVSVWPLEGRVSDLGAGLAGDLLALVRTGRGDEENARALIGGLAAAARWDGEGACWPLLGQALCGLAHGVSGVVLALAEAAAALPLLADAARPLIAAGLRWEAAWFDPVAGGWPDLRSADGGHPVMWCHGAAGIGAVRLRLIELGLDYGYPSDALQAEAHAAVLACGRELTRAVSAARHGGLAAVSGGLTLCHGMGGPLDVLALAAEVWDDPAHRQAAWAIASDLLATAPENPADWPSGVRAEGSLGLFVGTAGTAVVLARLLGRVGSPSLFFPAPRP